jgi:putative chitinase
MMAGQPNNLACRSRVSKKHIANLTYAGRLGNGSAGSGDGWRYRGRGLIQITGRSNYAASGLVLDLDLLEHPELLEQPYNAALSAAEWWNRNGCNQRADTGDLADVTRRVNGGLTGLDDRLSSTPPPWPTSGVPNVVSPAPLPRFSGPGCCRGRWPARLPPWRGD